MCLWVSARTHTHTQKKTKIKASRWLVVRHLQDTPRLQSMRASCRDIRSLLLRQVLSNTLSSLFFFFRRYFRYISKQCVSRLKCGFVKPPEGNCSESQGQRLSSCKALWSWCWNQKMESVSGSVKFSHLQWPVVLKYHHSCGLLCFCFCWMFMETENIDMQQVHSCFLKRKVK